MTGFISINHKKEVTAFLFHAKDRILVVLKFNRKLYKITGLIKTAKVKKDEGRLQGYKEISRQLTVTCNPGFSSTIWSTIRIMGKFELSL